MQTATSTSTAPPAFVSPVAEPLLAMADAIARLPAVLFWMTTRSWPLAPWIVPPVIVERLAPTLPVTRMPPEPSGLLPEASVSVLAPAELNRRLLAVIAPPIRPAELLTSMLPFA